VFDNLGIALGAGAAGVVVTLGDNLDWDPGAGVAVALIGPAAIAVVGLAVTRRLPRPAAPHLDPKSRTVCSR